MVSLIWVVYLTFNFVFRIYPLPISKVNNFSLGMEKLSKHWPQGAGTSEGHGAGGGGGQVFQKALSIGILYVRVLPPTLLSNTVVQYVQVLQYIQVYCTYRYYHQHYSLINHWGFEGNVPNHCRHGGLGTEPTMLEYFAIFFVK